MAPPPPPPLGAAKAGRNYLTSKIPPLPQWDRRTQRVLIYRGSGRLFRHRPASHRMTEKERQLADGRGREKEDGEKAWSSINHSMLSGRAMSTNHIIKCPEATLRRCDLENGGKI
jgi:hypothetical protein